MAKLTLSDPVNLQNESTFITTIATNNAAIETAMENTLSRDGTTPNTMSASLDMNSNRIINLPAPAADNDPARRIDVGNAPGFASAAAASATAAATSATNASTSATNAASSAAAASTSATNAATSETNAANSAALSSTNATVVVGNEYSFDTSTTMADPGTGKIRFNNATVSSVTALAVSASSNASGNPNIRSFINTWDDSTNVNGRGNVVLVKIGTPATYVALKISGAITDNTTWLQIPVTHVSSNGTWSASDRVSMQFNAAGNDGAVSISGTPSSNQFTTWASASAVQGVSITGLVKGNGASAPTAAVSGTDYAPATTGSALLKANGTGGFATPGTGDTLTIGTIELGAAADTTIARSSAGQITVEGVAVPLSSTATTATFGTVELGNATDTTLSRASAGVIAVEGVNLTANIPQNSQSVAYTAVLADANTHIFHPSSDNNARTFTIPANASVAYPIGTTLTFVNKINTVTIAINTDTLTFAGPGTTGSRTLAANGIATALKIASTEWIISGSGLT